MEKLLEILRTLDRAADQALIGKGRVCSNLQYGVKVLAAVRQADLGGTTNEVIDAVLVLAGKALVLGGCPSVSGR